MITQDQTAVIDFLASPSTHGGVSVERIETHTAMVFLAGTRAYKLKRAVLFDYLDFSSPEGSRDENHYCAACCSSRWHCRLEQ